MKEKYIKRLAEFSKLGLRGCPIDKQDELQVQRIFFDDDHYYFAEQDDGELWLYWE